MPEEFNIINKLFYYVDIKQFRYSVTLGIHSKAEVCPASWPKPYEVQIFSNSWLHLRRYVEEIRQKSRKFYTHRTTRHIRHQMERVITAKQLTQYRTRENPFSRNGSRRRCWPRCI